MPAAASRPVTSQPATGTATRPSPRALRAKITAARVDISNIETCLKAFEVDCGRFPTTGEGLLALVQQPGAMKGWSGPYLEKGVPKDPWGTAYQYLCPGPHNNKGFDLWSHGPDQKDGGGDDIDNWSDK
jgi:general secretion pathway protein G